MSTELEFDEKKFWIALFSAVIRREEKENQESEADCRDESFRGKPRRILPLARVAHGA
jgi:hypothetical protein